MNVLLINPPKENEITGTLPSELTEERGFSPPLGLLYIAGYLLQHTDYKINVLDSQVEKLSYDDIKVRIREIKPDVIGITAMTVTMLDVIETVRIVKEVDNKIKIVLGGPHVYLFPEETIDLEDIDFLVLGEGEEVFKRLLDNIDNKSELIKIPGLVFKDKDKIINTGFSNPIVDLDDLSFPARKLLPYKKYNSLLAKGNVVTTVFTSRGCPYQCSFCDRPHLGKAFRARSPKNVVDELEECTEMGIHDFLIYDDTFTVDKQRVIKICKEIIKRKLNIAWNIRARVDTVDEEVIKNLKSAGCQGIHYGVEAGTEKILKVLRKNITLSQVKNTFFLTKKYKISILAYFMLGNPSEDRNDIMATFKIMRDLNPDYVHIAILTPFPGTEIYFNGLRDGYIKNDYWRDFAKNPISGFVLPFWNENFTRDELNALLIKGYKSFYMRPVYIIKRLLELRSFKEMWKKSMAGLKIFIMK